jgi:AcrR family transcriptional regulator
MTFDTATATRKTSRQGRPPVIKNARERILNEASGLFARSGYENSSLSALADTIGVSKAAIYHYFRTKQEIYDAIIVRTLDGLLRCVEQNLASHADSHDRLRSFMASHARYFESCYWDFVCMLIGFGGMESAGAMSDANHLRKQHETTLRGILREGIEDGTFRVVDIGITATAILSMLNWMVRCFKPGGARTAEAFVMDYFELLAAGLRPRS